VNADQINALLTATGNTEVEAFYPIIFANFLSDPEKMAKLIALPAAGGGGGGGGVGGGAGGEAAAEEAKEEEPEEEEAPPAVGMFCKLLCAYLITITSPSLATTTNCCVFPFFFLQICSEVATEEEETIKKPVLFIYRQSMVLLNPTYLPPTSLKVFGVWQYDDSSCY